MISTHGGELYAARLDQRDQLFEFDRSAVQSVQRPDDDGVRATGPDDLK